VDGRQLFRAVGQRAVAHHEPVAGVVVSEALMCLGVVGDFGLDGRLAGRDSMVAR